MRPAWWGAGSRPRAPESYNSGMSHIPDAVRALERELRGIFGARLQSLAVYGLGTAAPAHQGSPHAPQAIPLHTLVVVDTLGPGDLRACAGQAGRWHDRGLATPLLLAASEFERSLDAFPLEFGAIAADHTLVAGRSPFDGAGVDPADVRRACEVQARSHLLHLREGYVETRGRADALALLVGQSAAPFAALVQSVDRLLGRPAADAASAARHLARTIGLENDTMAEVVALAGVAEVSSADAERLFPPYLAAVERLVSYVDQWSEP